MAAAPFDVVCIADYAATSDGEISLIQGMTYTVMAGEPSGLWYQSQELGTGKLGWFPIDRCRIAEVPALPAELLSVVDEPLTPVPVDEVAADSSAQEGSSHKSKSPRGEGHRGHHHSSKAKSSSSSHHHHREKDSASPRSTKTREDGEKTRTPRTDAEKAKSPRSDSERPKTPSSEAEKPKSGAQKPSDPKSSSPPPHATPAKPKSNFPEIEAFLAALKSSSSNLLAQSALDPEKFDKVSFNKSAKELMDAAEALFKLDNSKSVKAVKDEVKALVDVTIKLVKAKKAGAKKYRQKFVKQSGKFTQVHEALLVHCEQKYSIQRAVVQQQKAEDVLKRLGAGKTPISKSAKDAKKEEERKKREDKEKAKLEKKKEKVEDKELLALLKDSNKRLVQEEKETKKEGSSSKKSSSSSKKEERKVDEKRKKDKEKDTPASPREEIVEAWEDEDDDSEEADAEVETLYLEKEVVFIADQFEKAKKCVESGNNALFEEAIANMHVNMQNPHDNSNTLLHWAVGFNRLEMVRMLLMKGARNLANDVGMSPVEIAISAVDSGDFSFFEVRNLLAITLS